LEPILHPNWSDVEGSWARSEIVDYKTPSSSENRYIRSYSLGELNLIVFPPNLRIYQ